MTTNWAI